MSMQNLDILTFPLNGVRLIEASAGTGKTYTIAALYVRLVLGHGDDTPALLPPDILVVTFTEAATQELRDRIRQRLIQAARYFRRQTDTTDAFLIDLRAQFDGAAWPACAYRLTIAANWMDEAAIYTIHGWCNRMLQQHAFDSGSLFRQAIDNDDAERLLQVARDYWRRHFYAIADPLACRAVLQVAATPEDLLEKVRPLLSESEAQGLDAPALDITEKLHAWADWARERQRRLDDARAVWLQQQPALTDLLQTAAAQAWLDGRRYPSAGFAAKLETLHAWAAGGAIDDNDLIKFGRSKLQDALKKNHQSQAALFDHPALAALDDYADCIDRQPEIANSLLLHALHWMRDRYEAEKRRLSTLTFDDMLTRLDRALHAGNGDNLAATIRRQYPIALIDEFQDTDPLQYRIFATLYPAGGDQACLMIGDPKQAIYSFRGGDIYTYLKAYRATAGKHYTLNTNFRSTKELVAAVNRVFDHAEAGCAQGAFGFGGGETNPLPFKPVNAQGRKTRWLIDGQPETALTLWHWQSDDAVASTVYRSHMADVCASEIVRLLNLAEHNRCGFADDHGRLTALEAGDIAILVRSAREARAIRQALYRRGLKSVYLSERDSIYASPEARDVLIWLQALAEPGDERKVRAALATATLDLDYRNLAALADDEDQWEWHLEAFRHYQRRWRDDGILPAIRQLIADYHLRARLAVEADGERCLTNLLHLAELLQQASGQLDGEQALIRHLADHIRAAHDGRSNDDSILRLESDAHLIKVVTIHKSKGLEYPLVFLPFICSFREAGGRSGFYRYHNDALDLCIALERSDEVKTRSERERLQEDLRLLYVAVTRAQYACWLGIAPIKTQGKQCQLAKSAIGHVLDWQSGTASNELGGKLQALKSSCDAIAIVPLPEPSADAHRPLTALPLLEPPRTAHVSIADDWWIASYSALNIDSERLPGARLPDQPADTPQDDKRRDETDDQPATLAGGGIHALPRGAAAGVLIHELLENGARQGFGQLANDTALVDQTLPMALQQGLWQSHRETLRSALQAWLHNRLLDDAILTLADLDTSHYQAELEFLIGIERADLHALDALITRHVFPDRSRPRLQAGQLHGLLKGFIDLVFVHDGRYYVVDYKFNALGDNDDAYTTDALRDALLDRRYDVQSTLYLLAVHRLLKIRLGDDYDIARHLGGSMYLFLRGVYAPSGGRLFMPADAELILAMDALLS